MTKLGGRWIRPFIPSYVDALCPEVSIATLEFLGRLGREARTPSRPNDSFASASNR